MRAVDSHFSPAKCVLSYIVYLGVLRSSGLWIFVNWGFVNNLVCIGCRCGSNLLWLHVSKRGYCTTCLWYLPICLKSFWIFLKTVKKLELNDETMTVTTFILLGLTDGPQLQSPIFMFLFLTYVLSITGNLTIKFLTLVNSHLKIPMYFFLIRNFALLQISFTYACIPVILVQHSNRWQISNIIFVSFNCFYWYLLGRKTFSFGHHMSCDWYVAICKSLHYVIIMSNSLWKACFPLLDDWCVDHIPTSYHDSKSRIQWLKCNWLLRLLELMVIAYAVLAFITTLLCVVLSCICSYQDHSKIPLSSAKEKGLLYLFSHDCGFHYLWKVYLHLCQTFSKRFSGHY